ncbi:hypothetical protein YC2023_117631 [Brassica napus]
MIDLQVYIKISHLVQKSTFNKAIELSSLCFNKTQLYLVLRLSTDNPVKQRRQPPPYEAKKTTPPDPSPSPTFTNINISVALMGIPISIQSPSPVKFINRPRGTRSSNQKEEEVPLFISTRTNCSTKALIGRALAEAVAVNSISSMQQKFSCSSILSYSSKSSSFVVEPHKIMKSHSCNNYFTLRR